MKYIFGFLEDDREFDQKAELDDEPISCEPDGDDPHGVGWLHDDELPPSQADSDGLYSGEWPDFDPYFVAKKQTG